VPPRWLVRLVGRAGAKLVVCLVLAVKERPDWIVGYNIMPHGVTTRIVGGITRTRTLYHMIGGEREWSEGGWRSENKVLGRLPRPVPALERLLLRVIRGCTAVASMGEAGRRQLIDHGVDGDRVYVIPPSVDTARFDGADAADVDYDVLYVGALSDLKRTADVLHAAARVPRDARVALLGDGPKAAELRTLAEELGIADRVEFLGFREDVERYHARSRVFVLPSSFEGLSVAMLEAMASGLPPVVTDVGELGSFVRDGETGYVVPVGDVAAIAARVETLLANPDARAAMGAAAAADVRTRVSIDAVSRVYRELLHAHRP